MTVQPTMWGSEILVNTTTGGDQNEQRVAALADGGFVVVWRDASATAPDTSLAAVRAQRFDALGVASGDEFVVNATFPSDQKMPDIAGLPGGGFVVTWRDSGTAKVVLRMFDADSNPIGGDVPIASDVNLTTGNPAVAALSSGSFVVAWSEFNGDGDNYAVKMQRYDADATALTASPVVANSITTSSQYEPAIVAIGLNRFAVAWSDYSATAPDTSGQAVRVRIFNDDGSAVGTDILVNTTVSMDQREVAVTGLGDGNFIVGWRDDSSLVDGSGVLAQMFDADGNKIGSEFLVSTTTSDDQQAVRLTGLSDGFFFAVWNSGNAGGTDVMGQLFSTDGTTTPQKVGAEITIPVTAAGGQLFPVAAMLADGRIVVSWTDHSLSAPDGDAAVRMLILDPRAGEISGSEAGETIAGSTPGGAIVNDTIAALGGNDIVFGFDGNDTIDGGAGNDTLDGGGGVDTLDGGLGIDTMRGGTLHDIYVVNSSSDKAIENAAEGTDTVQATSAFALGANVEHLTLTGAASTKGVGNTLANTITGNAQLNTLDGGAGNDTLKGMGGNDLLIGGAGKDALTGGAGNDVFKYLNKLHSAGGLADVITDFDDFGDDRIDVTALFGPVMTYRHNLAFTAAGQVRILDIAGADLLVQVNTGGSLAADFQVRLTGTTLASMTASDFVL